MDDTFSLADFIAPIFDGKCAQRTMTEEEALQYHCNSMKNVAPQIQELRQMQKRDAQSTDQSPLVD